MPAGTFFVTKAPGTSLVGMTFGFAAAAFDPPGSAPDQWMEEQEEMQDVGVDGRRWRRVNFQFRPFRLLTLTDGASYDIMLQAKRSYELLKGAIGNLAVNLAGTDYRWKNVKVTDIIPALRAGVMVGQFASSTSLATLAGVWSLVLIDTDGTA